MDDNVLQYNTKDSTSNQVNSARQEHSNHKDKTTLANELNVEVFDDAFSNDDANNQFIFNEYGDLSPRQTPKKIQE